jgi:hypothetical protein
VGFSWPENYQSLIGIPVIMTRDLSNEVPKMAGAEILCSPLSLIAGVPAVGE